MVNENKLAGPADLTYLKNGERPSSAVSIKFS